MEYFDVLDKNRQFINKIMTRGEDLTCDEFNQGVEVWILTPHNKLLITQRSPKKSHPLTWEPPGGCSIARETTIDTAIREIKEEIGIQIDANNLVFLDTQLYKHQFVDIYLIKSNLQLSDLKLQTDEISQAKLVSFNEFDLLINQGKVTPYIVEHYNLIKNKLIKKSLYMNIIIFLLFFQNYVSL